VQKTTISCAPTPRTVRRLQRWNHRGAQPPGARAIQAAGHKYQLPGRRDMTLESPVSPAELAAAGEAVVSGGWKVVSADESPTPQHEAPHVPAPGFEFADKVPTLQAVAPRAPATGFEFESRSQTRSQSLERAALRPVESEPRPQTRSQLQERAALRPAESEPHQQPQLSSIHIRRKQVHRHCEDTWCTDRDA
jgi:hypothetical protein